MSANSHLALFQSTDALPDGSEEVTPFGRHFVALKKYPEACCHGRLRLDRFSCPDLDRLMTLVAPRSRLLSVHRNDILFLDTETTGVHTDAGIFPFLVGLGYFCGDEFHLRQTFIRDFYEEPSMLHALQETASRFRLVVTYNGACFDLPLLQSRFALARMENPFAAMPHLDLLPGARRLWRNGHGSCRLTALEREIIRFERGPDVPGALIPQTYFEFIEYGESPGLKSVFTHNAHDVVSLAALTIAACDRVVIPPAALDDPLDVYSLARILGDAGEWQESIPVYEMALAGGLPDPFRVKAIKGLIAAHRRGGNRQRALALAQELLAESIVPAVTCQSSGSS